MIDRRAVIATESERFADALASTDPGTRVPTCPDWTARDLLAHLTQVHDFWAHVVGDRLDAEGVQRYQEQRARLPDDVEELLAARRVATVALLAALSERDPGEAAWSWFPPDQTVGFTCRMQTHEATMHRVDAELTVGRPISPIDAEVAAEGIDHVVDVMTAWVPGTVERTDIGVVELRAVDCERTWRLRLYRWSGKAWGRTFTDHPCYERADDAAPTAVVEGRVEDLDLLLWTRADNDLERAGDPVVLAALQEAVDVGLG